MVEQIVIKYPRLLRLKVALKGLWSRVLGMVLYFGAQARFDRELQKTALTPDSIAKMKRELKEVYRVKKESGRLRVQSVGDIKAPPFPERGSLLTPEERMDPLSK